MCEIEWPSAPSQFAWLFWRGVSVFLFKRITIGAKRHQRRSGCLIWWTSVKGAPCEGGARASSSRLSLVLSPGQARRLRTLWERACLLQLRAGTPGGTQRSGSRLGSHHGRALPPFVSDTARWPAGCANAVRSARDWTRPAASRLPGMIRHAPPLAGLQSSASSPVAGHAGPSPMGCSDALDLERDVVLARWRRRRCVLPSLPGLRAMGSPQKRHDAGAVATATIRGRLQSGAAAAASTGLAGSQADLDCQSSV